ncbi:MAG TPA: hypothetical protein VD971_04345 [Phycisphaerales bacterium]|nr:hypothetical protein [Phycisphaerales bacterium]
MRRAFLRPESVFVAGVTAAFVGVAIVASRPEAPPPRPTPAGTTSLFVNWETPHVHPLELTPDELRLLAVNTPAQRLEVYAVHAGSPVHMGSISVGADPVAVRARTATEAWVVNHVSDTISIVDLETMRVTRTINTADEPCDVVFAGTPARAFVTCSQVNTVQVYDLANLNAAPINIAIEGEDPRSLAVSSDGQTVYAAIFESGNGTTVLGGGAAVSGTIAFPPNVVSDPAGPYNGVNPPPNAGLLFNPPKNPGSGTAPNMSLIVRQNDAGRWMDDNNGDWTNLVSGPQASLSGRLPGWTLVDQDVAAINAGTLSVSYARRLMNACMSLSVNPATGRVCVVGTDATNEVRFEPNVNGTFVRVKFASVDGVTLNGASIVDLNPHLTYTVRNIPQSERNKSIGDPRAIAWNGAGTKAYVAGMGSNNVVVINASGGRAGLSDTIDVGEGPTGLALDEARGRLYVLNKFGASISVVSTATETVEQTVEFFDPTPGAIKTGRKFLYDTHLTSGLGQASCASCHIDGRTDRLGWDLGDPTQLQQSLGANNLGFGLPGLSPNSPVPPNPAFQPFHPMKGPMVTQTFQDIVGHEPHHWRGDRSGLEAFAPAFVGLLGDDLPPTPAQLQEFEAFVATIHFPPNPNRNFNNTLPTNMPLPGHYRTGRFGAAGTPLPNGNAQAGLALYRDTNRRIDMGAFACVTCHTLPTGAGTDFRLVGATYQAIAAGPLGERHRALVSVDGVSNVSMKVPQLRNMYEKTGFNTTQLRNTAGFGYLHDGSVDSVERFIAEPAFNVASDQEVANLTAFMLCFSGSDLPPGSISNPLEPPGGTSKDTHAAVGEQTTLATPTPTGAQATLLTDMFNVANASARVSMIVKGKIDGRERGWALVNATTFQSDRAGQTITPAALQALAGPGTELTYTLVVQGTETRQGIDEDDDGVLNGDEATPCDLDFNNDGLFPDNQDLQDYLDVFGGASCPGVCDSIDFNRDGLFPDNTDIADFFAAFGGAGC